MSHKPISKDNREYWEKKLEKKFDEKKEVIESAFLSDIQKSTDKNYPKFLKVLKIQGTLDKLKKAELEYNRYKSNYKRALQERADEVFKHFATIKDVFDKFDRVRKWNNSLPSYQKNEDGIFNLTSEVEDTMKKNCYDEVRKDFYNSDKAKPLKQLNDWKEQAEDLLHSDMIGSEVLKSIQNICNQSKIKIFIPNNTQKAIAHSGIKEN